MKVCKAQSLQKRIPPISRFHLNRGPALMALPMKIVVLDGYTLNPGDNPWDDVAALGEFTCHDRSPPDQVVERAQGAEILLTNKTPISAETIEQLPDLKFIGVLATGYNVVDIEAARKRDIPVSNVPIYGTDTVAEYVFALMLNHFRKIQVHSDLIHDGEWNRVNEWTFWKTPMSELAGKTLGIVGFGRIGRRVGELAAAFRMKVRAQTRTPRDAPEYDFAWTDLETLFAESDIVSLHCPLTDENQGMVDRELLGRMKPSAYFINTARGPLVNDADLAAALRAGTIAGAALDVTTREPIDPESPLLGAPNLTITPHMAWAALEARQRLMKITADNIEAFLAGEPIHVVN